jgi:hypothetical protein
MLPLIPIREARLALKIVWATVSLVTLLILAAPFALGRDRSARLAPVCESRAKYGRACTFCGMTTSFLDVSEGRLDDAGRANRAGIPLYGLFVSNELGALAFFGRKGAMRCKR